MYALLWQPLPPTSCCVSFVLAGGLSPGHTVQARVVASSHAFAKFRDTLLARDNVLAALARARRLHTDLTTEVPGKAKPVITPAITALKRVRSPAAPC
jgi:hypothetical protein